METLVLRRKIEIGTVAKLILSACLIALSAQIRIPIPFSPVPFTGQTFAVMLIGALLGSRKGAMAAAIYLIQGVLGLPVFLGGASGLLYLMGPTGGYLLGLPLLAFLVGQYVEQQKQMHRLKTIASLFLCNCVHGMIGTAWLSLFIGLSKGVSLGFYPFLMTELAKVIALTPWLRTGERLDKSTEP